MNNIVRLARASPHVGDLYQPICMPYQECAKPGEEYAFDDGNEHTVSSFRVVAEKFDKECEVAFGTGPRSHPRSCAEV